jgi:hypothetical protein
MIYELRFVIGWKMNCELMENGRLILKRRREEG